MKCLVCILPAMLVSAQAFAAPEPETSPAEEKTDKETPEEGDVRDEPPARDKARDTDDKADAGDADKGGGDDGAEKDAAEPSRAMCPKTDKDPIVYGIGGSTMGSVLGPMLKTVFAEQKVEFSRWGKASSGLARPDFHDWPAEAPRLMKKHDPDIVVVSLGTNDYQPLWVEGNWVQQEDARWETLYGERVDALLEATAGKKKQRLVIWSGPYAFEGKNANVRAPIVNRIMRERVEAFAKGGGKAIFHDAYAATSKDGKPLKKAKLSSKKGGKAEDIRQDDGIHLTAEAVRVLLADPIVELVMPCFGKSESKRQD
jgi:hypothetical protein